MRPQLLFTAVCALLVPSYCLPEGELTSCETCVDKVKPGCDGSEEHGNIGKACGQDRVYMTAAPEVTPTPTGSDHDDLKKRGWGPGGVGPWDGSGPWSGSGPWPTTGTWSNYWGSGAGPFGGNWGPWGSTGPWTNGEWTSWWGTKACPDTTWTGWTSGPWSTSAPWTSWSACTATTTSIAAYTSTAKGGSVITGTTYGIKVAEATTSGSGSRIFRPGILGVLMFWISFGAFGLF